MEAAPAEVEPSADSSATETQLAAAGETSEAAGACAAHRWQCAVVIDASSAITLGVVPVLPPLCKELLPSKLDTALQHTVRTLLALVSCCHPSLGCGASGVCAEEGVGCRRP